MGQYQSINLSITGVNECASSPCENGGVCLMAFDGYYCACLPGFEGDTCQNGKSILLFLGTPYKPSGDWLTQDQSMCILQGTQMNLCPLYDHPYCLSGIVGNVSPQSASRGGGGNKWRIQKISILVHGRTNITKTPSTLRMLTYYMLRYSLECAPDGIASTHFSRYLNN